MNIYQYKEYMKKTCLSFLWVMVVGMNASYAAPGTLAQQPLFLGTLVQPNIFFGIDDSGSMDWEVLQTAGAAAAHPGFANSGNLDLSPNNVDEDYELCVGYNALAYNPATVYTPWRGETDANNTYADQVVATARIDPYFANGGSQNLLNPDGVNNPGVFGVFVDGFGGNPVDGIYQEGECPAGNPTNGGLGFDNRTFADARWITITSMSAEQQINYANWFSYYRKREFVAKRAISELIFDSNTRMGLATMHNNNNVGTPVRDMTVDANKSALLDELSQINSTGGTPLRQMLNRIGLYFDEAGANADHSALGFTNASPILPQVDGGECQQNFSVVFSDGFWNGGSPGVGNTDGGPSTSDFDGGSHADTFSNTLADVAMHYYERDLSTGLQNNVNTIPGVDENDQQHLTTYTVAFGINGTLANNPANREDPFVWPQPVANTVTTVDDMRHAAWNGRGEFLSAQDPDSLIASLSAALADISDRIGTATAVTFNSNQLDADSRLFLTQFNSEDWSGDLLAFDLDIDPATGTTTLTEAFSVLSTLDDAALNISNRTIYTNNGTDGSLFVWDELTPAQQNDLMTEPNGDFLRNGDGTINTAAAQAAGQARLAYLRGDRTHEEGGTTYDFRTRGSRLGDIVHAGPTFVGQPSALYPDVDPFGSEDERYSEFVEDNEDRTGVVYVGSNDGMLHAFNAENGGTELFGFIPSTLFSDVNANQGLHYLTDPSYAHSYYVDQGASVRDVYIQNNPGAAIGGKDWTTVLVGGLRAGGQGIFALDITDPNSFSNSDTGAQSTVMWEFDNTDSPFMGNSYSQPRIALLNNGEWAVLIGNGYNSPDGDAALIILFIEEGIDGTWDTTDFKVIETESGDSTDVNGIGNITAIDLNGDRIVDRVYGGDLDGNLWAFDLSSANDNQWDVAYNASGGTPVPLFTATDGTGSAMAQPITVRGAVTRTTTTNINNSPNILVILGSGQYLTTADPTNTDEQSLYGVWDAGVSRLDRSDLVEQSVITGDLESPRLSTDNNVSYVANPGAGDDFGWFLDLPADGERVIIDPIVRVDQVFIATLIPDGSACSDGGGTGFIMVLDAENGGSPTTGGLDFNNDGEIDSADTVNGTYISGKLFDNGQIGGTGFLGGSKRLFLTGTGGSGASSVTTEGIKALPDGERRRLSWQELLR